MQTVKTITLKISLALFIAAACIIVTWHFPGDYNHDLAALVNKRVILQSAPAPRLVFIGGSNLLTIRTDVIERRLRAMSGTSYSVVNMGLWGGLSMERYLEEIKPFCAPGDVVILCQEYATLLDENYFSYIRTNDEATKYFFLMSQKNRYGKVLSTRAIREAFSNILMLNQMKIKTFLQILVDGNFSHRFTGGYYRYRREYNLHGDRILPFRAIRPLISSGLLFQDPVEKNIEYLKQFNEYASTKNITVLIVFPPFPAGDFQLNKNHIARLMKVFSDMKLSTINRPEEMVYDESAFADTVYHLTPEGEAVRTQLLIERLGKALDRQR